MLTIPPAWRVFWMLVVLYTLAIAALLPFVDLGTPDGLQFMIRYTVRFSMPLFLLTFCASSLALLWKTRATRWLMTHRRELGVAFAYAFTWQMVFILWLAADHTDYFMKSFMSTETALVGIAGYGTLYLLTLTSFRAVSRHLKTWQWRLLHKGGVYVLAYFFAYAYVKNLLFVHAPWQSTLGVLFIVALLLRCAAWLTKRRRARASAAPIVAAGLASR